MPSVHQLSFAECLLASLTSGETLDALVSYRVPEPWIVSAPLSESVESGLMKLPGLRGQRIVAATTNSKKTVSSFMRSTNPSVRRALAYNPLLTTGQALALTADAAERRDGATVLALVAGRADFGTLLQAHTSIADLVSAKETHAGGGLIARRLLCSDEAEAKKILGCRELAARFNDAPAEKARALSRSSLRGDLGTVHLLNNTQVARYGPRQAVTHVAQYGARQATARSLGAADGASSATVEAVLASASGSLREALMRQLASNPQSSDSEMAALFSVPLPELNLRSCSEQAQRMLARLCAEQLTSLGAYQLFEEMLADWTGSLRDLTTVVSM